MTAAAAYTCREPGCQAAYELRPRRNAHEDREHLGSVHRVWRCWIGCGPTGHKYDEAGLRGHMQRGHEQTAENIATAWPLVIGEHTRLVDALMPEPEAEAVAEAVDQAPAAAPMTLWLPAPEVIHKELSELLRDYYLMIERLTAAEADREILRAERNAYRERLRQVRDLCPVDDAVPV